MAQEGSWWRAVGGQRWQQRDWANLFQLAGLVVLNMDTILSYPADAWIRLWRQDGDGDEV